MLSQKLLMIFGKGGTGRSTMAASMGNAFANSGQRTLIVQWSVYDSISGYFNKESAGHKHSQLRENLYTMNFEPDEALREYFQEYLGMKFFYKFILENQQIKKFIQAAPGLEELFFLGRILYLVNITDREDYQFDKIIVDAPATGHGGSLISLVRTIASFSFGGPLVNETKKVNKMLMDEKTTGILVSCLAEELPVEETLELLPTIIEELDRPALGILLNRSLQNELRAENKENNIDSESWLAEWKELLSKEDAKSLHSLYSDLKRRNTWESMLRNRTDIPVFSIPDQSMSSDTSPLPEFLQEPLMDTLKTLDIIQKQNSAEAEKSESITEGSQKTDQNSPQTSTATKDQKAKDSL